MKWHTKDGLLLDISDMETDHIINCLKMIWNHTVPVEYKIFPFRHYPGLTERIESRKSLYRQAIREFCKELQKRKDSLNMLERYTLKKIDDRLKNNIKLLT